MWEQKPVTTTFNLSDNSGVRRNHYPKVEFAP